MEDQKQRKDHGRGLDIGFINMWVDDVPCAVAFYEKLGLRKRFEVQTKDGGFAEFGSELGGVGSDAGSVRLCLLGKAEAKRLFGRTHQPGSLNSIQLVFVHDDVESVFRTAIAAGGKAVAEPAPGPCWGSLIARIEDPDGNLISLITRITPKQQAQRLYEIGGPAALEAMRNPDKADKAVVEKIPAGHRFKADADFTKFINQISDEDLARTFAAGGFARMEAALIERIQVE